jgi:hypothetical protein
MYITTKGYDDTKKSIYEKLKCVSDQFPMKMLRFHWKSRERGYIQTVNGNKNFHENSNDNWVTTVNIFTSNKSMSRAWCSNITNISTDAGLGVKTQLPHALLLGPVCALNLAQTLQRVLTVMPPEPEPSLVSLLSAGSNHCELKSSVLCLVKGGHWQSTWYEYSSTCPHFQHIAYSEVHNM